jgi:hypothetical protein
MEAFYTSMIDDAIARGEIPAHADTAAIVNMLLAMFLGMGFYAGFIVGGADSTMIAKQLYKLMVRGLLDRPKTTRSITVYSHAPASVAVDDFARTWPGLTLVIDVPAGQPFICANGAQPVVVSGDLTGEQLRRELYREFQVGSRVEGLAEHDSLDAAAPASARPHVG